MKGGGDQEKLQRDNMLFCRNFKWKKLKEMGIFKGLDLPK